MTPLETLIKSKVPRLEGYEVKALAEALIANGYKQGSIERCPTCGSREFPHACGGSRGWATGAKEHGGTGS